LPEHPARFAVAGFPFAGFRVTGWQHDRRSRHDRGYGRNWTKLREAAMTRDKWLCQPCARQGKTTPARECDHIIPKAEGGTDALSNLAAICVPCHRAKTEAEAARAQGRRIKPTIGADGWPV